MTCCELEIQFKAKFSSPKDIILLYYYFPNLFLFVVNVVHFYFFAQLSCDISLLFFLSNYSPLLQDKVKENDRYAKTENKGHKRPRYEDNHMRRYQCSISRNGVMSRLDRKLDLFQEILGSIFRSHLCILDNWFTSS